MSGMCAIGLVRPKDAANVGGVLRAAHAYGASLVAIAGDRSTGKMIRAGANTSKAQRVIPVMRGENMRDLIPFDMVPIAVDLIDGAIDLREFSHPKRAFYIFGPEDGTLGHPIIEWCSHKVYIPTAICLNLAAAANVVLYDRIAKARHVAMAQHAAE